MRHFVLALWLALLPVASAPSAAGAQGAGGPAALQSSNLSVVSLTAEELSRRGIEVVPMGDLVAPTGAIVATDPLVGPERPAFARVLPPGRYPVSLFMAEGAIALAMLRIAPGDPVRWELAVIPGQDAGTLSKAEIFGYPVDAGLGSFMDKAAAPLIEERLRREEAAQGGEVNYFDNVLAAELSGTNERNVMHRPIDGNDINVAVFSSGFGDGFYPSFWGMDADGRPLVLLTDFYVLENAGVPGASRDAVP